MPESKQSQQDVAENKYLATILERLRQNQIADDAQKLVTGDKGQAREAPALGLSRGSPSPGIAGNPDISTSRRTRHFYSVLT
jgi:hypothetical protein